MSQTDVRLAGGPTDATLRRIERGSTPRPDFVTLAKLDKALKWTPGSANRAFEGGDPEPLVESREVQRRHDVPPRLERPITAVDQGVLVRTDALADLTRKARALDDLPGLPVDQAAAVTTLRHAIDRLTRAWIVRQAEVARHNNSLTDLILVLDDHLRSPPSNAETAQDQDDLKYLRWLAGYDTPQTEDVERFENRFAEFVDARR